MQTRNPNIGRLAAPPRAGPPRAGPAPPPRARSPQPHLFPLPTRRVSICSHDPSATSASGAEGVGRGLH